MLYFVINLYVSHIVTDFNRTSIQNVSGKVPDSHLLSWFEFSCDNLLLLIFFLSWAYWMNDSQFSRHICIMNLNQLSMDYCHSFDTWFHIYINIYCFTVGFLHAHLLLYVCLLIGCQTWMKIFLLVTNFIILLFTTSSI